MAVNESLPPIEGVKRKDVLRRTATVLFSSFAAAGAVEGVPLPASAQHVIGFAMVKVGAIKMNAVLPESMPATRKIALSKLKAGQPPPKISGFVVLNVPAGVGTPTTAWKVGLGQVPELGWLLGATNQPQVYALDPGTAASDAPQLFGAGGIMRYGEDGATGVPLYDVSNQKKGNDQIFLLLWP